MDNIDRFFTFFEDVRHLEEQPFTEAINRAYSVCFENEGNSLFEAGFTVEEAEKLIIEAMKRGKKLADIRERGEYNIRKYGADREVRWVKILQALTNVEEKLKNGGGDKAEPDTTTSMKQKELGEFNENQRPKGQKLLLAKLVDQQKKGTISPKGKKVLGKFVEKVKEKKKRLELAEMDPAKLKAMAASDKGEEEIPEDDDNLQRWLEDTWGVNDELAKKLVPFLITLKKSGNTWEIKSGFRDPKKQKQMRKNWDAGNRSGLAFKPAINSKHTKGTVENENALAVDIVFKDQNVAGKLAKKYGLRWGGNYKNKKDVVHFYV
jgi:hypothetical protein